MEYTQDDLDEAYEDGWDEACEDSGIEHGETVIDAIAQIRRGEYANAITTLEREFMPKWQSTEDCLAAFRRATA